MCITGFIIFIIFIYICRLYNILIYLELQYIVYIQCETQISNNELCLYNDCQVVHLRHLKMYDPTLY